MRPKCEAGVVYFAVVPRRRVMKIGLTSDVTRRLQTLRVAERCELRLVCAIHKRRRYRAARIETALHEIFRKDRVRPDAKKCDWVHITPRLRDLVRAIKLGEKSIDRKIVVMGEAARRQARDEWSAQKAAYRAARAACWAKYGHEFQASA